MLLSFITGSSPERTRFRDIQGVDLLVVDVTKVITPTFSNRVTESPVEDGSSISDNARKQPVVIQVEGYASETPLSLDSALTGLVTSAAAAVGARIGGGVGAAVLGAAGGIGASLLLSADDKAKKARDALISLVDSQKLFDIATPFIRSEYTKNLIMENLTFPRDTSTGRGVRFTCTLKQIRVVETQTVKISRLQASVLHSASAVDSEGKRGTTPASEGRGKSILSAISGRGA